MLEKYPRLMLTCNKKYVTKDMWLNDVKNKDVPIYMIPREIKTSIMHKLYIIDKADKAI